MKRFDMDMEVKTALDKFYNIFDNPQKYDLFFYYNGLRYQLSSGGYILTERAEDCEDEMEYGFDENGKDLAGFTLISGTNSFSAAWRCSDNISCIGKNTTSG